MRPLTSAKVKPLPNVQEADGFQTKKQHTKTRNCDFPFSLLSFVSLILLRVSFHILLRILLVKTKPNKFL